MNLIKLKECFYKRYRISFAKSGEDIQLAKLIGTCSPGWYVDVGCWHPIKASNTYYFYLRGWKGICIDPNPEVKELFRKIRPDDIVINCAVGANAGEKEYFILSSRFSSMSTLDYHFIESHNLAEEIIERKMVTVKPLSHILEEVLPKGDTIDFMDIDVEGQDLEVISSNDWTRYRPKIVLIESNNTLSDDLDSEMHYFMKSVGYSLRGKTLITERLGNLFFIRNDLIE